MRRFGVLVLSASLLAACAGSAPATAPPSASPAAASTVPSVGPSPTPAAAATAQATAPVGETPKPTKAACPAAGVLDVVTFVGADPVCFGGSDVTIQGWLGPLPPMGWEAPYIEPAWLAYPPDGQLAGLFQTGPGGEDLCGSTEPCSWLLLHVAPNSAFELGTVPRLVRVTGHRDDPAAAGCHYVLTGWESRATPDPAGAVEECRGGFVVTGVTAASAT